MTFRTAGRTFATATALSGALLGFAATSAAAGTLGIDDGPADKASGFLDPVINPIKPGYPPLQPTPRTPDTAERPHLIHTGCVTGAAWTDAKDPDGSDLRMTVEVAVRRAGRSGFSAPITMPYLGSGADYWAVAIPTDATSVVIQTTDEDGYHSRAEAYIMRANGQCEHNTTFQNSKTEDIFEILGAR